MAKDKDLDTKITLKWQSDIKDAAASFDKILNLAKELNKSLLKAHKSHINDVAKVYREDAREFLRSTDSKKKASDGFLAHEKRNSNLRKKLFQSGSSNLKSNIKSSLIKSGTVSPRTFDKLASKAPGMNKTSPTDPMYKYERAMKARMLRMSEGMKGFKKDDFLKSEAERIKKRVSQARYLKPGAVDALTEDVEKKESIAGAKKYLSKKRDDATAGLVQKAGGNIPGGTLPETAKSIQTAGESLKALGGTAEVLGKAFTGVAGLMEAFMIPLSAAVAVVAGLVIADKATKEQAQRVSAGVGGAGYESKAQLGNVKTASRLYNRSQNDSFGGLRTTGEEVDNAMASFQKSGMTMKALGGDVSQLTEATDTAVTAARNFGLTIEDGTKIVADYRAAWGYSSKTLSKNFAILTDDIKNSGLASNQFLSILQGVSSHFNIFLDQTLEFSKVIRKLGESGEYSQTQIASLMDSFSAFSAKGWQQAIANQAQNPKGYKNLYKNIVSDTQDQLDKSKDLSSTDRKDLGERQAAAKRAMSGGALGGIWMDRSASITQQMATNLSGQGLKSAGDVQGVLNDPKKLIELAGRFTNGDVGAVTKLLPMLRDELAKSPGNNLDKYAKSLAGNPDMDLKQQAKETALAIASETIPQTAKAAELGNSLLLKIAGYLNDIYNQGEQPGNKRKFGGSNDLNNLLNYAGEFKGSAKTAVQSDNAAISEIGYKYLNKSDYEKHLGPARETLKKDSIPGADDLTVSSSNVDASDPTLAAMRANLNKSANTPDMMPSAAPGADTSATSNKSSSFMDWITKGMTPDPDEFAKPTSVAANTSAAEKTDQASKAAKGTTDNDSGVNIEAQLYLKDNAPIELIVQKVLQRNARKH